MHLNKQSIATLFVTALFFLPTTRAHAQDLHHDVEIKTAGSRLQADNAVYVTQFDTVAGTTASESPGFGADADTLVSGEVVKYQAIGQLHYWDPAINQWTLAPNHLQIRLAGGLDLQPNQIGESLFLRKLLWASLPNKRQKSRDR